MRVAATPLPVCLDQRSNGYLINLSEAGALVRLPVAPARGSNVMLEIKLPRATVELAARVVRSVLRRVEVSDSRTATAECDVALEFLDVGAVAPIVRHIIDVGST